MAYAPAGNLTTSPGLTHLATVYYERKALDTLMKKFLFRTATEPDILPKRSGKTIQFYRYGLFGANSTPHSEGTVGTSLSLTTTTVSGTLSEYADFISISSFLEETAIDPIVENATDMLGYRAGLSADVITRTEFDTNIASVQLNTLGTTLTANDLRRVAMTLEGNDVRPRDSGNFEVIAHPFVLYDLMSDNTAGGFIDVMKYADPSSMAGTKIGNLSGCSINKSTNVQTTGTAPTAKYYTYIVGKGAVGAIDLAGVGPTKVTDPATQSFKINVIKGGPSQADPEGMIGSYVSYRFVFVAKTLDSTTYRYRIVLADSSII